jgi:predicted DNA-binding antitoxin AbrB/MazE fold protein
MLKSYEAIYKNGILRWLDQIPIERNKELRVLVVVEVNETQPRTYVNKRVEKIDPEIHERLQKWFQTRRRKPQGGSLRPIIQGKTVAQRVLEDRGE